ncbi:MAG: spore coat associated protein CotJA [Turicibacter sp.]|nr:spore coat associated protein CotJA [Turicibacter sp.]
MENEYYTTNPSITYQKTTSPQARADQSHLTCSKLPLATTYIRMQTYGRVNTPTQTLQQGTAFNELYSPYTPKTTSTPMVYMLKGGQQ